MALRYNHCSTRKKGHKFISSSWSSVSWTFRAHKMAKLVQQSFWWPSLNWDSGNYMKTWKNCLPNKGERAKAWGPLKPLHVPSSPWEMVSMDLIVNLPPSKGYITILVIMDRLSKMFQFVPMTGTTAAGTVHTFIREAVRLYGMPSNIISDRGGIIYLQ